MKELEIEAITELITFYKEYLARGINEELKRNAIILESKYQGCDSLVHDVIIQAVGHLVNFYVVGIPHGKVPDKEKTKKIIKDLEERKKELMNS